MSGKISKCSHLFHRTQTSPKTGTRACSNRYTGYQVRFSVHLLPMCVCVCVFVRVCLSLCVFVCVCVFCSQSSVLPKRCVLPVNSLSLYVSTIAHRSETPEENPYRPTYMFPENYDRLVVRSKGIQWR